MLYQIMHKAEANDLIRKNPVRFAEKMKAQRPVKRKEAFTQEEVQILMEQLPWSHSTSSRTAPASTFGRR